ncbi:MFS_1 domain-containing protein [Rhizoctonia solani AG-1 IA]|uniref:MFS_1 domain-containing protein n=1 Tax=Thanatephorus cucumeris (strain AG1-IA) TaxID=983506 RepID=L8WLW9_THACA|nr:MFS_1 domain-containing protein [Rhizoctonia solani AG-1 IA]
MVLSYAIVDVLSNRLGNALLLTSMCGAIGLLWAVNSAASNWVAVAIAGFFLGPNTPGILSIVSTRVPPSLKEIVVSLTIGTQTTLKFTTMTLTVQLRVSPCWWNTRIVDFWIDRWKGTTTPPPVESCNVPIYMRDFTYLNQNFGCTLAADKTELLTSTAFTMSQTTAPVIELDVLPRLEHGITLDHTKSTYARSPELLTGNSDGDRFPRDEDTANPNYMDMTMVGSGHTLVDTAQPSQTLRLHIGNVIIEEKVLYLVGSCIGIFAAGLNFTATGANLPSFQKFYQLSYQTVSLVFLASFGGQMASALHGSGALLISFAPPFPVVVIGLTLMGFGGGFYEACLTSVVSHDNRFMNIMYAFSGLVSPFVIGALTKSDTPWRWLTSYLIDVKGTAPDISRYQLSVFWAGACLTAGRIFFSLPFIHVRERIGNNVLLALMGGAVGLLWGLNTTASNWVSIAVAGFFLGPNTPGILSIISTRVPPSLKEIVISVIIAQVYAYFL